MELIKYNGNSLRIDVYLAKEIGYSRNFFHHLFMRNAIKVNGNNIKKSYKLKSGDEILIESMERYLNGEILSEMPFIELDILLEKEDYLVIYKPKGVLSHPNSLWDLKTPSVVGFVYNKYKNLPYIGNFVRAGIIHRLDKETDGLMIIVKSELGLLHFKKLFYDKSTCTTIQGKEKIQLKKYYKAKTEITQQGILFLDNISTNLPYYIDEIVETKGSYIKDFKKGITKILDYTILEDGVEINIEILTGRTHQIRYHLTQKGLPIIGDGLYGNACTTQNLYLTAYKIEFIDPYGNYEIICI